MALLLPAFVSSPEVNKVYNVDAFALLAALPDKSVDAFITDLPYAQLNFKWDALIPFDFMWKEVRRTLKTGGVFITTASQPFTSILIVSNLEWFREELIWDKCSPVDYLNVHKRHMKQHETVIVFGENWDNYYPIFGNVGKSFRKVKGSRKSVYGAAGNNTKQSVGYPKSILRFPRPNNFSDGGLHPTQKPVALYEYLIRTYTQPADLVVDFCCGSGTTALAARNLNRNYIVGDITPQYVEVSRKRLAQPYTPNMFIMQESSQSLKAVSL